MLTIRREESALFMHTGLERKLISRTDQGPAREQEKCTPA